MTTLTERLGYGSGSRVLIVNADELGFCHAANVGIFSKDGVLINYAGQSYTNVTPLANPSVAEPKRRFRKHPEVLWSPVR